MTRRPFISSSSNPRLKSIRRLRRCSRGGVFLVEGFRQLSAALEARACVRELYVSPELYLGSSDAGLVAAAERGGTVVTELGPVAFESIAGNVRPDGIVAVVERRPATLDGLRLGPFPLLLVAGPWSARGTLGRSSARPARRAPTRSSSATE
jgi:tRNA G18 (ribose-2'-O)-methylase SpoU